MKNRLKQAGRNSHGAPECSSDSANWQHPLYAVVCFVFVSANSPIASFPLLHGKSRHTQRLLELPALTWLLACSHGRGSSDKSNLGLSSLHCQCFWVSPINLLFLSHINSLLIRGPQNSNSHPSVYGKELLPRIWRKL